MTNHTPGPWRVGDAGHTVFGPKTNAISPETIATMGKNNFRENARLIAAAPELLDILKAAVARVKIANYEGDPILSAWLPDAESAIAKAEGRE